MAESIAPHRGSPPPADGMAAVRIAFPQTPEDFENDPRVSFSRLDDKWILEEDDGSEWEWSDRSAKWLPALDEGLLEQQRQAYKVEGVDEESPVQPTKKRKPDHPSGPENEKAPKKQKTPRTANPKDPTTASTKHTDRKNTAVYATSIPLDAHPDEINHLFSRCGMIAEEIDRPAPRIKMYRDDAGSFKGDALVVYFRPESVPLAIQMLDDSDFRFGEEGPQGKMRVREADFSYKKSRENQEEDGAGARKGNAAKAPAPEGRKPPKGGLSRDQRKIIRKTENMNSRLADWDDDDPQALQDTSSRFDKVVVLKHMFTLEELEEDPAAILDIKEDIREECAKLGPVTNTVLFDAEPDGVATVRFGNAEAALACVRVMDGRSFGGQVVEAAIATGGEKFRKSGKGKEADDGDGEGDGEGKRLDEFGRWLEGKEGGE